jgi:hypothetical protein
MRFISFISLLLVGCTSVPTVVENPLVVPAGDFEYVWQQTVEVLDEYFEISSENRIDGRIETYPQVSATLLEPWRRDAVDGRDRLENTLQTYRRRAFVHLAQEGGGYAVQVEVHRELEDLPHPAYANTGDAMFRTEMALHREQQVIGPIPLTRGWIPEGRDWKLETQILNDLSRRFGLNCR